MPPKREIKDLYFGVDAHAKIMAGAQQMYQAVSAVYGPGATNAMLGLPYGDPTLTRDGVTVAKRVTLKDKAEDDAAQVMRQASDKTNKTAGDGTTATIVLAWNLLWGAHQRRVAGENAMVLKRQLDKDMQVVTDYITSQSINADKHLLEVATVSSGDANIGKLVSDTLKDVGIEGGITIREQSYPTIDVERVNGYYFDKGFFALNQQIEYERPHILVSMKRLSNNSDVLPLIKMISQRSDGNTKLVIVGEVNGEAMNTLMANTISTQLNFECVVIPPPAYNEEAKLFMEDIATYVGADVLMDAETEVDEDYFGTAGRVQVSQDRAIIFEGGGDDIQIVDRAAQIKTNIDKEENAHKKDQLEQRYSKLVSKIAIVNVGASTPTEMEELRFRVEDAIEATKSAMQDGVVPGGATMLVKAADMDVSSLFQNALLNTFRKLMTNAAEAADYRLKQVQSAKFGQGFNLRDMTDEPIDLAKAGIWDATRAVVQVVENAVSAAGALLTVGAIVAPNEEEDSKTTT